MNTVTTANVIKMIRGHIRDILKTNGKDCFQYDSDPSFSLSQDFVSSTTIKVYKNGTLLTLTSDYTYNSDTNQVTILTDLTKKDDIIIKYSYYEKYSDTEIICFINASLSKFVIHRYPKYFYLNSSDEVVTKNGINPTVEEGNIIAVITAIDIDPNNVNIKTKDFSISAEENMSKTEQIDKIFSRWMRTFGDVTFLENDN